MIPTEEEQGDLRILLSHERVIDRMSELLSRENSHVRIQALTHKKILAAQPAIIQALLGKETDRVQGTLTDVFSHFARYFPIAREKRKVEVTASEVSDTDVVASVGTSSSGH